MNTPGTAQAHVLQCMEIWNSNRTVENRVSGPGVEAWIFSKPFHGETRGGDVHYLTLCAGGVVTRIALADVAGHGTAVADTSKILRTLLRRFMNAKRQDSLVSALNREFTVMEESGRFATAIIATYLSHKRRLLLTNAGHPRPLFYRQSVGAWQFLDAAENDPDQDGNLPLGIDDSVAYQHFDMSIDPGDWLLLYTDAVTESEDAKGAMLGERGLAALVSRLPITPDCEEFGRALQTALLEHMQELTIGDDMTLLVLRFQKHRRVPGMVERIKGYAKVVLG